MAAGDVVLTLAVEGGSTKTVALSSAVRVKSKSGLEITDDVDWAINQINRFGRIVISQANKRLESEATWTPVTFTEAT